MVLAFIWYIQEFSSNATIYSASMIGEKLNNITNKWLIIQCERNKCRIYRYHDIMVYIVHLLKYWIFTQKHALYIQKLYNLIIDSIFLNIFWFYGVKIFCWTLCRQLSALVRLSTIFRWNHLENLSVAIQIHILLFV